MQISTGFKQDLVNGVGIFVLPVGVSIVFLILLIHEVPLEVKLCLLRGLLKLS